LRFRARGKQSNYTYEEGGSVSQGEGGEGCGRREQDEPHEVFDRSFRLRVEEIVTDERLINFDDMSVISKRAKKVTDTTLERETLDY